MIEDPPIVFINIGWMKRYQGPSSTDKFNPGNFGYFRKHKKEQGIEAWNFVNCAGWVYGYVPRSCRIDISRLGALKDQDELKGVLVVFMARDPAVNELKVVGWYSNATVSRSFKFNGHPKIKTSLRAQASDSHVLLVTQRNLVIPTARKEPGGVGESPVWYGEKHPNLIQRVRNLVKSGSGSLSKPSRERRQGGGRANPKNRLAVEKVAMDWAMSYFDNTKDVSKECKGWDIEANGGTVLIEVKGLSGSTVSVELTPNEYEQMLKKRDQYLLFIVTHALTKQRKARTFRHRQSSSNNKTIEWVSERGEVLKINERVGARAVLS